MNFSVDSCSFTICIHLKMCLDVSFNSVDFLLITSNHCNFIKIIYI